MDFVEQVASFLRASKGRGFCDNCLRIRAKLARPQQAHEAGTALAATDAFLRAEAHCAGCGSMKTVTWAK